MLEGFINKAIEGSVNKLQDTSHSIFLRSAKNDKPINTSIPTKIMFGLGTGAIAAGTSVLAERLALPLTKKMNPAVMIAVPIGSAALGYMIPDIANKFISESKKKKPDMETTKEIVRYGIVPRDLKLDLSKSAGIIRPIVSGIEYLGRAAGKVGTTLAKQAGKGIYNPAGNKLWYEKARSFAVKGGLAGGAGYGVYKANQWAQDAPQQNYDTFLRNNVVAGNISPNELNTEDMQAVQRVGMR